MRQKSTIIIKIRRLGIILFGFVTLLAAHGGFDHVLGTVVKTGPGVLTVKTAKGNVDVRLDAKTEITKNDQNAAVTDLVPGARVVVDIPETSKDRVAHSVKIGVTVAPKH